MTKTQSSSPSGTPAAPLEGLPFEQALAELEQIVSRLERGDVPLEESITIFERGEQLKKHCDALLKKAEARIEKISVSATGDVSATPLDIEE